MVKRYPHTAIVFSNGNSIVNGELVESVESESQITGRFDSTNSANLTKTNPLGNEVIVQGAFYTQAKPISRANRLKVEECNIDRDIICWEKYQTHTIIYV